MKAFDYSLVKDPQYFCDNRMEAHSDHVYYRDGNEMQTAVQDGTETSFRYSLNGLWKFHYARITKVQFRDLRKKITAVMTGMTFMYLHISRWKDMMHRSMLMSSIHGKDMRKFIRVRFLRDLIRLQAM